MAKICTAACALFGAHWHTFVHSTYLGGLHWIPVVYRYFPAISALFPPKIFLPQIILPTATFELFCGIFRYLATVVYWLRRSSDRRERAQFMSWWYTDEQIVIRFDPFLHVCSPRRDLQVVRFPGGGGGRRCYVIGMTLRKQQHYSS
jgi:hypothetical protein